MGSHVGELNAHGSDFRRESKSNHRSSVSWNTSLVRPNKDEWEAEKRMKMRMRTRMKRMRGSKNRGAASIRKWNTKIWHQTTWWGAKITRLLFRALAWAVNKASLSPQGGNLTLIINSIDTKFSNKYEDVKSSGVRFSKVPKLFGRITGDIILFDLQNEGVSRHETLKLFSFLFTLQHMKIPDLQNKRVGLLRTAFRARKVFGTFEKRAPVSFISVAANHVSGTGQPIIQVTH